MKKRTRAVLLCVGLALCMSASLCTHVKADDAFIVEEEAIIGGESLQEEQGQAGALSQVPPPAAQEPVAEQKHVGDATKTRASGEKKAEETKAEKKEEISHEQEESVAEKEVSVSQNTGATVFQVPVRKSETEGKAEEKDLQSPDEGEAQEEMLQIPEPDIESATKQENPLAAEDPNPWWMLAVGGVFFFGGCVRFLWRLRDRKGSKAFDNKKGESLYY